MGNGGRLHDLGRDEERKNGKERGKMGEEEKVSL